MTTPPITPRSSAGAAHVPDPRPPADDAAPAALSAALRALPVFGFSQARLGFDVGVASQIDLQLAATPGRVAADIDCGARVAVVDIAMGQALLERQLAGRPAVIVVDVADPELWSVAAALHAVGVLPVGEEDPERIAAQLVPLITAAQAPR